MPILRRRLVTVWVDGRTLEDIVRRALRALPNETGGMLLGYWGNDRCEPVIVESIPGGPNAAETPTGFLADGEWQQGRLAARYEASGRIHTYMGDWHSHPSGSARPSGLDRRTARAVAADPRARASRPVTIIVAIDGVLEIAPYVLLRRRLHLARLRIVPHLI